MENSEWNSKKMWQLQKWTPKELYKPFCSFKDAQMLKCLLWDKCGSLLLKTKYDKTIKYTMKFMVVLCKSKVTFWLNSWCWLDHYCRIRNCEKWMMKRNWKYEDMITKMNSKNPIMHSFSLRKNDKMSQIYWGKNFNYFKLLLIKSLQKKTLLNYEKLKIK
jgi:hypothetical protein